jgi:putative ABC transport system permease protein
VTSGFFDILGVGALHGRTFLPEEYEPGRGQVIVIGYGLWQRRFGGDPQIVGQQLTLNGRPHTVVGVMPREFQYPQGREVWAPRSPRESDRQIRGATYIKVIGRLKPDLTVEQAQAEMNGVAAQLAEEYPQTNSDVGALALPIREYLVGDVRPALLILFGAVCFVLLIACANVASLLLARAAERRREFAIRAALGAGHKRLLRQLLVESLLLASAGGGAGVLLSLWLIEVIVTVNPGSLPHLDRVELNGPVLVFAAAVSVLTALVSGLAPALQIARPDLQETLRQEGHTATFGRRRQRFRNSLVIAEVALAMVLLVGAGLLVRSFIRLIGVDPGFHADRALTLEVQFARNRTPEQRLAFIEQTLERVAALPGVESSGAASAVPFHDNQIMIPTAITVEGRPQVAGQEPSAYVINATPEYLQTLGVPLLGGRLLNLFDRPDTLPVVVINQTLAQIHWPGDDPLGKRITFQTFGRTVTCEIVGVVGSTLPSGLDSQPRPEVYLPYAQSPAGGMTYLVRTEGDPSNMLSAVKEKIREVNPNQSFSSIATLEQLVDRSISQRRFNLLLLGLFAGLALVLAAVGLYGLISFTTAQRTHEIGIRMALGAQGSDVLRMIIRQGIALVSVGVATGLIAAFALTRLMGSLLYGVSASDPVTFLGVPAALLLVALAACYIPARRATKVDPIVALRYE